VARKGRVAGRRTWRRGDGRHDGDRVSKRLTPGANHRGPRNGGLSAREQSRRPDCERGWRTPKHMSLAHLVVFGLCWCASSMATPRVGLPRTAVASSKRLADGHKRGASRITIRCVETAPSSRGY
jgi:hypothetical protein